MKGQRGFVAHMRAFLMGALLLVLCQVVIESVIVAAYARHFLLSPFTLPETQMYDFCVKLFRFLPGSAAWIPGSALDRFLPVGFHPKLVIAGDL